MSQPFSFPPPPPPPPRRENAPISDFRGGRGSRGHTRGLSSRGNWNSSRSRGHFSGAGGSYSRVDASNRYSESTLKRNSTQAFGQQPQARPKAPPAVPSFDLNLKATLPAKPVFSNTKPAMQKNNALGLTPATQGDISDSEDSGQDEARLNNIAVGDGMSFEHKGQTLSLRTAEEVASWIAERRKKFPTQAKVAAAKKEAEERRLRIEEQRRIRNEATRIKKEAKEQERSEKEQRVLKGKLIAVQVAKAKSAVAESKEHRAVQAKVRAEKLRQRAEKAARELEKAEQALRLVNQESPDHDLEFSDDMGSEASKESVADDLDGNGSDRTSSSGSSAVDTESDSEPEVSTSKRNEPNVGIVVEKAACEKEPDKRALCKNFTKFGRCRYGKKCRYLHQKQKPKQSSSKSLSTTNTRKGLYQVMVDKEREDELKHAVRAIITLGDQGLLDENQPQ